MKSKYLNLLFFLQKYIACEGHFKVAFLFHIQLLAHFHDKPLNFPYYLRMSLMKMSTAAKERGANLEESLYHHGLVKMILVEVLKEKKWTWEEFLAENYFAENEDSDSSDSMEEAPTNKLRKKPRTCGLQIKGKEEEKNSDPSKSTTEKPMEKTKKKSQTQKPLVKKEKRDDLGSPKPNEKKPEEKPKKKKKPQTLGLQTKESKKYEEVVVTGEMVGQNPKSKNGTSTSAKGFTRSQVVQLAIKDIADAEVLPETPYKKKEKHHSPPKGKEKIDSVELISEEAMSFQDSLLHGSGNNTEEEQQAKEDLGSPQSLQGHQGGEVTPQKRWSLQELE